MNERNTAAIAHHYCPVCKARRGHPCWSTFLDREMVEEVHRGRGRSEL